MKVWKISPRLKRNLVILAVVAFVGAAAYLNWSYNQRWSGSTAMADKEDEMTTAVNALLGKEYVQDSAQTASVSGYFSQARLTRQRSRDEALSLLESAACAESASAETIDAAMREITQMANWSMMESRIESELLAKDFADCMVYLSKDSCTVAVPAPSSGLEEKDVARITDAVTSNTDYTAAQINVIEVMDP